MPKAVTSRRIFRRWLSKAVKWKLKFRGYFDLYNIPFRYISLFDFTEKKSPLRPGGMNRGTNIFDFLERRRIAYHVSEPTAAEENNYNALLDDIRAEQIDFAFAYWPELDGLLHRVGNQSAEIPAKLRSYEKWIGNLMETASHHYEEVRFYIFSDHGMANCDELLDLKSRIEPLGLEMGKDYAVVYDSTMARFWFFNDLARNIVTNLLRQVPQGSVLSDDELEKLRCDFEDRYFGELIFLVREGVLIVPSDMGERPLRAMHGYHPLERHSYAALLSNQTEVPDDIRAIPDIYRLMVREASQARERNASSGPFNRRPPTTTATMAEPVSLVSGNTLAWNKQEERT